MDAPLIIVRGGGDIASGTIHRLHRCGFRLLILEAKAPVAIRRTVSFCEAVSSTSQTVEGVTARLAQDLSDLPKIWQNKQIPVFIDPEARSVKALSPAAVIDAILAKKNLGTSITMAPITIGLGPGFTAGTDVHFVIETARGHDLGRILHTGAARTDTGVPGPVQGYTVERVLYATCSGRLTVRCDIGSLVTKGEVVAAIDGHPVTATITGTIRGMLRSGFPVRHGMKLADIDPRPPTEIDCRTISDKARCISGSVLEVLIASGMAPAHPQ